MASVLKVDKLDPQGGTALELGTSGDTISIPSGATLDISASTLTPPATMPASSGVNLTALNATNLGSGTVPTARLGTGTASSSTVLYGDQTYKAEPGGTNTPYFLSSVSTGGQLFTNDVLQLADMDVSVYDSATGYNTTDKSYTIPTGEGGYWAIGYSLTFTSNTTANKLWYVYIQPKNGGSSLVNEGSFGQSIHFYRSDGNPIRESSFGKTIIASVSAGDVLTMFANIGHSDGSGNICSMSDSYSNWWGYKLIT
jgi:hypothetical protein